MKEAKKFSILIVDDESANILNLTHILGPDYTIYAAKNGVSALKAAKKHLPDVILLDIIMPDMDGYEVLAALKESERTNSIPVIFVTGLSEAGEEEKGLVFGAADYLIKPFSPALVKLRVQNQLKLIEQFRANEYDIMKYKLANDALKIALWDMDVVSADPVNPVNKFIWSQEFRQMLGFTDESDFPDILQSWSDRLHPEDKEKAISAFAAHLNDYSGQTPFDIEYRLKLKNGDYHFFHALGTTQRDKDGVPLRVSGALMDISEKREMENERANFIAWIEANAHWYKSILDAIPLPINVTDTELRYTFVNKALEELIGRRSEDMIGKPCDNRQIGMCMGKACGPLCRKRSLQQTYVNIGDSSYQIEVELLRDMEGSAAGYIEVAHDITNIQMLAKQQAEAEMTSRAKSSFLANMSHEIRTPMNAIWGITEILLQDDSLSKETMDGLARIYNSCNLLLGIINDILDLSKIEAGKLDINPAPYDTASLINDAIQLNIMRRGEKSIEFIVKIDENIPAKLVGDEIRIKQILNNLLSNAFKYTEEGEITLCAHFERDTGGASTGGKLVFSVQDTGHGMTAEQVEKLFDEYSRFQQGSGRTIEGTGLGMAITRHMLDLMGGVAHVESEPGKGSIFTVSLPQGVVDDAVLGAELADNLQSHQMMKYMSGTKSSQTIRARMPYGSVLVVDDVETNLYVAEGLMKPYGLKIDTTMSGKGAIDKIKKGAEYDVIFMDHMMPIMDGVEAVGIIRSLGYKKPIVALTANALVGQADMLLENGFDEFIAKPIDIRRLDSVLNKLVRDRQPPEVLLALAEEGNGAETKAGNKAGNTLLPFVGEIAGLDIEQGLARYFGDTDTYMKILRSYVASTRSMLETVKDGVGEDIKFYETTVHGIKGASYDLFANDVGDRAKALEMAAKNRDLDYIAKENAAFVSDTATFIGHIEALIKSVNEQADKPKRDRPDEAALAALLSACDIYDMDGADAAMAQIEQYEYTADDGLVEWLRENVDLVNFKEIAEKLGP